MSEIKWIKTSDKLPNPDSYVLIHNIGGNWHEDSIYCRCVVAKFKVGISLQYRNKLSNDNERKKIYYTEDEHANNQKPYAWKTFGGDYFFGQDVDMWCEIPQLPEDIKEIKVGDWIKINDDFSDGIHGDLFAGGIYKIDKISDKQRYRIRDNRQMLKLWYWFDRKDFELWTNY